MALRVDGEVVRSATVGVPADGNRTATLTHAFDDAGSYALTAGDESLGTVTVDGPATPAGTASATDTAGSPDGTAGGSGPGFGVVGVLVAVVATALAARRRA